MFWNIMMNNQILKGTTIETSTDTSCWIFKNNDENDRKIPISIAKPIFELSLSQKKPCLRETQVSSVSLQQDILTFGSNGT